MTPNFNFSASPFSNGVIRTTTVADREAHGITGPRLSSMQVILNFPSGRVNSASCRESLRVPKFVAFSFSARVCEERQFPLWEAVPLSKTFRQVRRGRGRGSPQSGSYHVEETWFSLFVETRDHPQEIIDDLEAGACLGIGDVNLLHRFATQADLGLGNFPFLGAA